MQKDQKRYKNKEKKSEKNTEGAHKKRKPTTNTDEN